MCCCCVLQSTPPLPYEYIRCSPAYRSAVLACPPHHLLAGLHSPTSTRLPGASVKMKVLPAIVWLWYAWLLLSPIVPVSWIFLNIKASKWILWITDCFGVWSISFSVLGADKAVCHWTDLSKLRSYRMCRIRRFLCSKGVKGTLFMLLCFLQSELYPVPKLT